MMSVVPCVTVVPLSGRSGPRPTARPPPSPRESELRQRDCASHETGRPHPPRVSCGVVGDHTRANKSHGCLRRSSSSRPRPLAMLNTSAIVRHVATRFRPLAISSSPRLGAYKIGNGRTRPTRPSPPKAGQSPSAALVDQGRCPLRSHVRHEVRMRPDTPPQREVTGMCHWQPSFLFLSPLSCHRCSGRARSGQAS
jgi:hypothetical protein